MKDSWVTHTVIHGAALAMDSSTNTCHYNHPTTELPANKSTEMELTKGELSLNGCHFKRNSEPKEEASCPVEKKNREWCSRGIAIFTSLPPSEIGHKQSTDLCDNQPMDIPESIECIDDQEQIVPQSVASCNTSRPNASDDPLTFADDEHKETTRVSSGIMKMGLKDLLDEVHEFKKSEKTSFLSNGNILSGNIPTSIPLQNQSALKPPWHGQPLHRHTLFGPLARPLVASLPTGQPVTKVALSISKTETGKRASSPIITHKKFDYQKKLLPKLNAPFTLCKRSTSSSPSSSVSSVVTDESKPMDLTTKKPNTDSVQCLPIQNPLKKMDTLYISDKTQGFSLRKEKPYVSFGATKSDSDPTQFACKMSSLLLPRPSCSPNSSEHSSGSTISTVESRSNNESSVISNLKFMPDTLSRPDIHLGDDSSTMSPLRLVGGEAHCLPILHYFDPSRHNKLYAQQVATKRESGIYQVPTTHCLGYTAITNGQLPSSLPDQGGSSKADKMFICQECGTIFKHRHHVVRHMRSHSGERPFRCDECGATFARKCILTNHLRTHTGEKPYICSECGDTFSRKHHLVIHRRTHTGEKPYICPQCGAAFARSHHLNRHRKTHAKGDLQAQETNRIFTSSRVQGELPLHRMHGLPTMLPLWSPSLMPTNSSVVNTEHMPTVGTENTCIVHTEDSMYRQSLDQIQEATDEKCKTEPEQPSKGNTYMSEISGPPTTTTTEVSTEQAAS